MTAAVAAATPSGLAPDKQSRATSVLIGLLALALFINALDRGNFSTAAPLIKDALALSNSQLGLLFSAFFMTYVPGHALSGWLADRLDPYRTLALGLGLWSLATLLTGFAASFTVLLVLRLLLGLGESTFFPSSSKLLALHSPPHKLASANAWIATGLMLGNGAGVLVGGLLIAQFGWHALFFVFGGLSLLWLVPWLTMTRPEPMASAAPTATGPIPSYGQLLSNRQLWGAAIAHFCGNYPYFIVLSWLPTYLVKQQGFSITAMAMLGGAVYLLSAVFSLIGGTVADRMVAAGRSVSRVRLNTMVASNSLGLLCMLACATGSPQAAVAALLAFSLSNGLGAFGTFAIGQTLAGPRAAGRWVGFQNGFGGLAGVVGPWLTGRLIDATGDYRVAFLIAALSSGLGVVSWTMVVRKVEPIAWV